jgi:hypothetical protein
MTLILHEIEITSRKLKRDLQIKKVTCIEIQLGEETSYQHQRTKHFPLQPSQGFLQMSSLPKWQSAQNLPQSSGSCFQIYIKLKYPLGKIET